MTSVGQSRAIGRADGPTGPQARDRSPAGSGTPRWIPGFVLAQVAVLLLFAEVRPGSFEGVPGGLGALISVAAAIVCGPLAGALVSLVGGLVFVPLVTDFERGSQFSMFLWLAASVGAGVISGRLRQANEDRAAAVGRERLAGNRLHRLQADHRGPRASDDPGGRREGDGRRSDLGARRRCRRAHGPHRRRPRRRSRCSPPRRWTSLPIDGWRRHAIDTPAPGPEIVRTGRPIFIETRGELLARFPIVTKIEGDAAIRRVRRRPGGARGGGPRRAEPRASTAITWCRRRSAASSCRSRIRRRSHLNRIRSGEDERRARATAEHAEDRLRKLQAVSDAANAATGLDELVERVLPVVRDAVLADGTSFLLLSDDGRGASAQGQGRGRGGGEHGGGRSRSGAGASGRIARDGAGRSSSAR